jgi:serine/threonine protein kinase
MPDRIGHHIDDYRLTQLLGTGSFGEVYLGEEHLENRTLAAVKMLNLSQENLKEFVKEVSTVYRLKHPSIIGLLAFGMSADDTPYLVMDYASNGTLRQRHPKGTRLSLDTIISYLLPLAEALQYAHDKRVIHRDVKPVFSMLGILGTSQR